MKKGMMWIIIAVVVVVLAIGAYFYFSNNPYANQNTNQNTNSPPANSPSQTPMPSANPTGHSVAIMNFAFSPSSITISKGDTVVWTNQDSVAHSVISDSGNEISSQLLSQGQTYSHTFTTSGTFSYHCSVHPSMKGTIIVQ